MTRTILIAVCFCLATGVAAQTPPVAPDAPAAPPARERAIVGGKDLQPRPVPGESGQSPEAQLHLLQRGAQEPPSNQPVVVPRDIYGNPLGGNPGLNPPHPVQPPPKS
jgi:hypothetical protein